MGKSKKTNTPAQRAKEAKADAPKNTIPGVTPLKTPVADHKKTDGEIEPVDSFDSRGLIEVDENTNFYNKTVQEVYDLFDTDGNGLSKVDAKSIYESKKPEERNELAEEEEKSLILEYLEKYTDPMVVLLLISAGISIAMNQLEDAASIVLAVIIVTTVGFVQEYKSEKAVDALKDLVAHHCIVKRDGKPEDILASELVEGDIVELAAGMRVPADLRIVETSDLAINESLLTGESEPVVKTTGKIDCSGSHLAERINMAYMGTSVAAGTGAGVVCAVGRNTELGKLSEQLQDKAKKTPLQMSMDDFGKQLSFVSIVAIVIISVVGFIQGKPALQMFNMAVSLIVAAIPEGLPIAVTVTLALGVTRMSARNAIVRKLPAVEALGATNVICVDKTGTLTQNQMTVTKLYDGKRTIEVKHESESLVSGDVFFYCEKEDSTMGIIDPKKDNSVCELLTAIMICNDASIDDNDEIVGQPTDGGLLSVALKSKIPDLRSIWERNGKTPFSSNTKYMSVTIMRDFKSPDVTYYKGASEVILPMCDESKFDLKAANEKAQEMASSALRVIAVASRVEDKKDITFLGLVGLRDPPRMGVKEAIKECNDSDVRVVMITGDSKDTAIAVAKDLGMTADDSNAMSATDIDECDNLEDIRSKSIFYRMTPAHKVKVVEAHSKSGAIVAMTGDGVNDAPALNKANIGIAMGRGSDVCKEASEIILVDNNFSTIVAAIEEGKVIFENIQNFLHFQLSTSIGAMLLTAVCSIIDIPIPINPTQILLINIIMDGPPAQSLTFEKFRDKDDSAKKQPPRDPRAPIVSLRILAKIIVSAIVMVLGTIAIFLASVPSKDLSYDILSKMDEAPRYASTMAFTTFVLYQLFNAMNCRSINKSAFMIGLTSNHGFLLSAVCTLIAQFAVIYLPPLQSIFRTTPISFADFGICMAMASTVWFVDEMWKLIMRYH